MSAEETRRLLEARIAEIPAALRRALDEVHEPPLDDAGGPVLVTGGGMSEGPARYLVALLAQRGVRAAYVPLSEFVAPSVPQAGGTLVLFSQGLAPNARFPLLHVGAFRRTVVVTAVAADAQAPPGDVRRLAADAEAHGARILTLPPASESGLLLRVVGPVVHGLAAVRLARPELAAEAARVPEAFAAAFAAARVADGPGLVHDGSLPPVALVASGRYADGSFGLRWKLLEGLHVPDPPVWDILQVAHGPLQSLYERAHTLIVLARPDAPHEAALVARLPEVLVPSRHRVLTLGATLPGLLAWFEHDAQLDALVLAAHRALGIDLQRWPAQGLDGPLYDLAP